MSLRPLQGKVRPRNIAVYDLEWIPGNAEKAKRYGFEPMQLRLIGAYDGKRYVHFHDPRSFLNWACTAEHSGRWYYAHAGGLYDLAFLLEYIVDNPRNGVTVQCAFSGSAAIIVKVMRGRHAWYFVDSYWLIRQPLREIGKWVGQEKGGSKESTDHFYGPLPALIEYNEKDCRILYAAIRIFEASINKIGGQLQKTIASTALDVFKRVFLKETISTDETVNTAARIAYCASRVEVFETDCRWADYYDVNSSFPYAMTFPAPGNLSRIGRSWKEKDIAIVKAVVNIPTSERLPVTPYRDPNDGRVYFPTGRWSSWFSSIDLQFLEESGGRIERVEEAKVFEPFHALKDYAETIYEWRKEAESEALKVVLKFLLNSLYGKFGEGSQKQKVLINPPKDFFKIPEREPGGFGREMLMPGVHALVENKVIPHAHVPISVHITAIARRVLGNYLRQSPRVYYCDTDGFAVPHTFSYPTSNKLGGLKLEKHVYEAKFLAPKLYAYRKDEEQNWTVRGKGFSRILDRKTGETHSLNYEDFKFLIEHKDLHLEQFARLRTLWKSGDTTPREIEQTKTWRGVVRTKRRMLDEGGSVPWNVKELQT
jgi:hypothetical protein